MFCYEVNALCLKKKALKFLFFYAVTDMHFVIYALVKNLQQKKKLNWFFWFFFLNVYINMQYKSPYCNESRLSGQYLIMKKFDFYEELLLVCMFVSLQSFVNFCETFLLHFSPVSKMKEN